MTAQTSKVKGVVDLVFLLDVTGSMQPVIDALKINIEKFIDLMTTKDANNASPVQDWRAKVVGYRDYEVDKEPLVDAPFVRDAADLKRQLNKLHAEGGGDEPESLLDALYKVASIGDSELQDPEDANKWRHRKVAKRLVVVFTDASFKPKMAISEAKGGTVEDVINIIMEKRIILTLFAPENDGYNKLAEVDKCEFNPLVNEEGEPVDIAEFTRDTKAFQNTLAQLAKSLSASAAVPEC